MLGTTLLAELVVGQKPLLSNLDYLKFIGQYAATRAGATIYGEILANHKENEYRVIIPLGESHIAIYTNAEEGTLLLDIFACRGIRASNIFTELKRHLPNYVGHERHYPRGKPYGKESL